MTNQYRISYYGGEDIISAKTEEEAIKQALSLFRRRRVEKYNSLIKKGVKVRYDSISTPELAGFRVTEITPIKTENQS